MAVGSSLKIDARGKTDDRIRVLRLRREGRTTSIILRVIPRLRREIKHPEKPGGLGLAAYEV